MPSPDPARKGPNRRRLLTAATLLPTVLLTAGTAAHAVPRTPAETAPPTRDALSDRRQSDNGTAGQRPDNGTAGQRPATPAQALRRLAAGNHRFRTGRPRHPRRTPQHLRDLAAGQRPYAIVVGCADSRIPPEILFDEGLGDLFVNRVAGNLVNALLLGSIEYAVHEFDPPLLLVLGHERCGAVTATVDALRHGEDAPGHVQHLVEALRPVVAPVLHEGGDVVERAVRANVRAQAAALYRHSRVLRRRVDAGTLLVVGARYDLDSGTVTRIR